MLSKPTQFPSPIFTPCQQEKDLQQGNLAFPSQRCEKLSRSIKKSNLKMKNSENSQETLLPSELDDKVLQLIKNMRQARCVVNYNIAIATCKQVVLAKLIFQRTDFTKRQAATSKQPVPPCFLKEMGFSFH